MKKNIAEVFGGKDSCTVIFTDDSARAYSVRYTNAGRRYIRVYGKRIYDYNGKAI